MEEGEKREGKGKVVVVNGMHVTVDVGISLGKSENKVIGEIVKAEMGKHNGWGKTGWVTVDLRKIVLS